MAKTIKKKKKNTSDSHILFVRGTMWNKQESLASLSTENFIFLINLQNKLPALRGNYRTLFMNEKCNKYFMHQVSLN